MKPSMIQDSVSRRRERLDMRDEIDLRHLLDIIADRAPKLVDQALDLQDNPPSPLDDAHHDAIAQEERARRG